MIGRSSVPNLMTPGLMAPLPARASEGIKEAHEGVNHSDYANPAKRGKKLHSGFKMPSGLRQKRRRGGKTHVDGVDGHKPHERLDRKARGGCTKETVKEIVHKHEKHEHSGEPLTKLKHGGRLKRKDGGATKGRTNITIVLGAKPEGQSPMNMQPSPLPDMQRPIPIPAQAPPMPPPSMPPGMVGGGLPPGLPPMPRKSGGRAAFAGYKMDAGSESGEGRLQKSKWYGGKSKG